MRASGACSPMVLHSDALAGACGREGRGREAGRKRQKCQPHFRLPLQHQEEEEEEEGRGGGGSEEEEEEEEEESEVERKEGVLGEEGQGGKQLTAEELVSGPGKCRGARVSDGGEEEHAGE